jgi:hypothetical protein
MNFQFIGLPGQRANGNAAKANPKCGFQFPNGVLPVVGNQSTRQD